MKDRRISRVTDAIIDSVGNYIDSQRHLSRSASRRRRVSTVAAAVVGGVIAGVATGVVPGSYCQEVPELGKYQPPGCVQVDNRPEPKPFFIRPTTAPATNPGSSYR